MNKNIVFYLPISLLLSTPMLSFAEQSAKQQNTTSIEKITVFGEKTPAIDKWADLQTDFDRSFSIETIYSEQIDEKSIINVKDALKGLANVRITDQGAFNKTITMRGMNGGRTVFLIDGIKLADQGLSHSGAGEANLADINQIDRIEVVKGSPSVLYDPGATGGVVNIINKTAEIKDHFSGKYRYSNDSGYLSDGHAMSLSAAKYGFSTRIYGAKNNSDGYKIKNKDKLNSIIQYSNERQERIDTPYEYTGLGYKDESFGGNISYFDKALGKLSVSFAQYDATDMTFTHGASSSQVFRTDQLSRQNTLVYYSHPLHGDWHPLSLAYSESKLDKRVVLNDTQLSSRQLNLASGYSNHQWELDFGAQYTKDDAQTAIRAEQDYWAAYLSGSFYWDQLIITSGIRANYWSVNKLFRDNENESLRCQLEGAVGCLAPQNDFEPTYSLGLVYRVNQHHNFTANYAKTHRQPNLYERIAFDSFWGCFDQCEAEHANNIELAWKWMNHQWYSSVNLFATRFDSYLNSKEIRQLKNIAALESCIKQGLCDPLKGEFNNQESDFFSSNIRYYSTHDVDNIGAEAMVRYQSFKGLEASLNLSFNKLNANDPFVGNLSQPWELNLMLKKQFSFSGLSPWIMAEYRWVSNTPTVRQKEGFSAFNTVNLYAGASWSGLAFNIGVRNISNAQYHEPYGALDGLARSAFFNISASY